ncbi:MAG TPA: nitrate ABC transporter ATP-binding protein, partial [Verrucomicrobiales bacterium]|nr:nitrate ABC transporter ATP-binding protein [Verrucomicrobiales bacterium]
MSKRQSNYQASFEINRRGFPSTLRLGFIPLLDCAPLVVAQELGWFETVGLDVCLSRELGWGTIKEKIACKELEGAHALAGMAFSIKMGLSSSSANVSTGIIMSHNGNALTLHNRLWEEGVRDLDSLRDYAGVLSPRRLNFGVVAHSSTQLYLLNQWLKPAGTSSQIEINVFVVPPPQLLKNLKAGVLDGFCAGEPWNSLAILEQAGWCAATGDSICPG